MSDLDITFRFNDENNTFTNKHGLSIEVVAEFLKSIYNVTKGISDENIVLSEIRGNCYAMVMSMQNPAQNEYLQNLYSRFSSGNVETLKSKEREHYNVISSLIEKKIILNIYTADKKYYKTIDKLKKIELFPHYFETDVVKGIITKIGSRNIDTRNSILISSYSGEIEITDLQDHDLKIYYKKELLEFYITKKINTETGKVDKTILDDFVVLEDVRDFASTSILIKEKHGKYFVDKELL